MGGAILSDTDGIMRPHENRGNVHDGREADRTAHVISKHKEGATVGTGEAVQNNAVNDGAHAALADTEVEGAAVLVARPVLRDAVSGQGKDGSPFIVVLFEPARSAEPPHSSGSTGASADSTPRRRRG